MNGKDMHLNNNFSIGAFAEQGKSFLGDKQQTSYIRQKGVSQQFFLNLSTKLDIWAKSSITTSGRMFLPQMQYITAPIKQFYFLLLHDRETQKKISVKLRMEHLKDQADLYRNYFLSLTVTVVIWKFFSLPTTFSFLLPIYCYHL